VVLPRVRSRKRRKATDTRPPFERVLLRPDPRCGLQTDLADAPLVEEVRDVRTFAMGFKPEERIDTQRQLAGRKLSRQRGAPFVVTKHTDIEHRQVGLAHHDLSTKAIVGTLEQLQISALVLGGIAAHRTELECKSVVPIDLKVLVVSVLYDPGTES